MKMVLLESNLFNKPKNKVMSFYDDLSLFVSFASFPDLVDLVDLIDHVDHADLVDLVNLLVCFLLLL